MELIASYCLTEPGSGSDAAALRTRAVRDGDHYVLNGQKQFISGAGSSRPLCRDGAHRRRRPGRHLDLGGRGRHARPVVRRQRAQDGLERAADPRGDLRELRACRSTNRLGDEGNGFKIAMAGLDGGRLNIAACSLGGAQAALDKSLAYMKRAQGVRQDASTNSRRCSSGSPTWRPNWRRRATFLWRAAAALDRKDPDATMLCAMAKRFGTDVGFEVANQALQLHGGYGYSAEYGIEKIVRDLRVHQILEGTNEIMRVIISRKLSGERLMAAIGRRSPSAAEGKARPHHAEPAEGAQRADAGMVRDIDRGA